MKRTGEVVLVRIAAELQRPLLVLHADGEDGTGTRVTGVLFVDPDDAQRSEWLNRTMASQANRWQPYHFVRGVYRGPGVGQWEPRADAADEPVSTVLATATRVSPARRRA